MTGTHPGPLTPTSATRASSRRQFLVGSGITLAALTLGGGALSGCSKKTTPGSNPGTTAAAGPPQRGGTLRFGASGGASSDSLDAHLPLTNTDNARMAMLYDQLVRLDNKGAPEMVLAESITPNADASEWTVKIHSGVVTHKGKKFTAQDVLFSVRRMFEVKSAGASAIGPVDLKASTAKDDTTLIIKYKQPYSQLIQGLTNYACNMVPEGYDPKDPDGTGPFKFKEFTPGVSSTFVRNENYWVPELPYLDAIVTTNISDETAQISGLQSGQLDVINFLSANSVAVLQAAKFTTVISKTGSFGPFTMRVDKAPFSDVRVRQALRMIPDRDQMLKQVFGGFGSVGNDVFGITDPLFPTDLPQRKQDLEQAKSLLKAAGQENLTIELVTTDNAPGQVNAATVFATQAKGAGVTVNINKQTPTDYFSSSYLKVPFSQDYNPTNPYLVGVSQWTAGLDAPYNPSFFNDPAYLKLYAEGISSPDPEKQRMVIHDMAHLDYDTGGNIIPYFFPTIDACNPKLQGIEESATGLSPGGFYFKKFWFTS